ncbi:hypothetical protein GCM10008956_39830 [Deinococcus arenae]|uniref:Uncharacterized protein n=1 Tax=Deinococcus arenae TaxID=1452751 RepID=A0A8H9LDE5_9DEIO|nr:MULTISPECIES: hypothetical protein [Deinococcus]GGM60253.1 hypothetical protein GCM10008956_39830 [Deinococcus arenae]
MTPPDRSCLTYLTTCDPTIQAPWPTENDSPDDGLLETDQDFQLDLMNLAWLDLTSDDTMPDAAPAGTGPAARAMLAAARLAAQQPTHPALTAMHAAIGPEPLFLMLSQRVLWYDSADGEWLVPGLGGGLYAEGRWPAVPEYAENDNLDVAGLLGVVFDRPERDRRWVRLVLWPMTHPEVAALLDTPTGRPHAAS